MKTKLFLLIIPCFSLLSLSNSKPAAAKFITSFKAIGPFMEYGNDYEMTGTVTPKQHYLNMKERLSVAVTGYSYSYFETKNGHDVTKNESYQLTFTLPLKSMLSNKGITCLVEFLDNDYSTIQSFTFNLKPMKRTSIDPHSYINDYFIIKDTIVDPDNYKNTVGEKMRFDGYVYYFNIDNYYRLDLNNLTMSYSCLKSGLMASAFLHFDDYDRLFEELDIEDDVPYFNITLYPYLNNGTVIFKIAETLYVHPKTLSMSFNAKPDYVPTHYFYLPINKKAEMFNQKFTLNVLSFGLNQTSFSWELRYMNTRGLIGDCHDSDYCVRGEV